MPVRKLLGVGPKTEARLTTLGVTTIGALAATPLPTLQHNLGEAHGRSQGIDETPLITAWEPHSFGRQITFQKDIIGTRMIAKQLNTLVETALDDAREGGYLAKTVTVRIRFSDFKTLNRQVTLPCPSSARRTIARAARECLKRIASEKKVRLIGVRLSGHRPPRS